MYSAILFLFFNIIVNSIYLKKQFKGMHILNFILVEEVIIRKTLFFFFNLFLAVLGLHCCMRVFSSCSKRGLLFLAVRGLLIAVASLVVEHRLQARGLQQLWHVGSVVVVRRLQSAGSVVVAHGLSCSPACGIFPDQGSNPCPLHWQVDS